MGGQQTQVEPFDWRTSTCPLEQDSLLEVNIAFSFVGGLCSYTPSKVHIENTFELGVSRVVSPQAPTAQVVTTTTSDQSQDYLKPAEENVPWSAETSSDLLFWSILSFTSPHPSPLPHSSLTLPSFHPSIPLYPPPHTIYIPSSSSPSSLRSRPIFNYLIDIFTYRFVFFLCFLFQVKKTFLVNYIILWIHVLS